MRCDKCDAWRPYTWMGGHHRCLVPNTWLIEDHKGYAPAVSFRLTPENLAWLTDSENPPRRDEPFNPTSH